MRKGTRHYNYTQLDRNVFTIRLFIEPSTGEQDTVCLHARVGFACYLVIALHNVYMHKTLVRAVQSDTSVHDSAYQGALAL